METSADLGTMVQTEGLAKPPGAVTQPGARNRLRWFVLAVVLAANVMDTWAGRSSTSPARRSGTRLVAAPPPSCG